MALAIIIFICFVVVSGMGAKVFMLYRGSHKQAVAARRERELEEAFSWPARQVMKSFLEIPEANRPIMDISAALKALDKKHDAGEVSRHFISLGGRYSYSGGYPHYTWNCSCIYDDYNSSFIAEKCDYFPEYREMHDSILGVSQALREQQAAIEAREHQMMLAGMENDLRAVEEITNAFRNEREIITSTTKEII